MRVAVTVRTFTCSEYAAVVVFKSVKAAVLFLCLLFANNVLAADYMWRHASGMTSPSVYSMANTLGSGYVNGTGFGYSHSVCTFYMGANQTPTANCIFWVTDPKTNETRQGNGSARFTRYGDSCPTGTGPYDPLTGECVKPTVPPKAPGEKCDDQTGGTSSNPMIFDATVNKCVQFTEAKGDAPCTYMASQGGSGSAFTVSGNLDSGGNAVAPPTFIDNSISCQVATVSTSECTINVAGAITCNVIAKLTGKGNSQGATDAADSLCPNGKCPVKEAETKTTEEGCTPIGNGSGGTSCTQKKETAQEGTQQCGTVNGAYKCFTKPPYSNGVSTSISATSQTLPDGSVKLTTVKDSSNTVCTDVKKCTTTTSTTTTNSTTKPNGSTTTDTSCKGSCTPNGGGVETNPSAGSGNSGNGSGGGGTGGDGEGEEGGDGTASTTDKCDATPACDGDPFLCAILKQDHIDTCKLMADATAEQKASADAKTSAAYAKLDAHQAKLDSDVNGLLSKFQSESSLGGSGGGKCLEDKKFSVAGHSMDIPFSQVCDSLSWLRLVVLAGAYLFAARIVSREV